MDFDSADELSPRNMTFGAARSNRHSSMKRGGRRSNNPRDRMRMDGERGGASERGSKRRRKRGRSKG